MAKQNVISKLFENITAPVGGAIQGTARGLFPGWAGALDRQAMSQLSAIELARQKQFLEAEQLMLDQKKVKETAKGNDIQAALDIMKDNRPAMYGGPTDTDRESAKALLRKKLFKSIPQLTELGRNTGQITGGWSGTPQAMPNKPMGYSLENILGGNIPEGMAVKDIGYSQGYPSPTLEPKYGRPTGAYAALEQGGKTPEEIAAIAEQNLVKPQTSITLNPNSQPASVKNQLQTVRDAQKEILDFKKNPQNADLLKNYDLNIKSNTQGQLIFDVQAKAKPNAEQVQSKVFMALLKDKVTKLNSLVAKGLTGPVVGRVRSTLAETLGGQNEFVQMKQILDSLILRAYMLSGKQISGPELTLLKSLQPQADDPTDTAMTRLKGFYEELQVMSELTDDMWQQLGFRIPDVGTQSKATPSDKPANKESFVSELSRLNAEKGTKAAQEYYQKWVNTFDWEKK